MDEKVVYETEMNSKVRIIKDESRWNPFNIKPYYVERIEDENQSYSFHGNYANLEVAKSKARRVAFLQGY